MELGYASRRKTAWTGLTTAEGRARISAASALVGPLNFSMFSMGVVKLATKFRKI
jgi:hypothetical protein